jgi:aspartate dehydrogenase
VRVALIGIGSIGAFLFDQIRAGAAGNLEIVGLADVPGMLPRLAECAAAAGCSYTTEPVELAAFGPDIVVEAASQAVVRASAVPLLERGVDLLLMSVGALADPALYAAVEQAAARAHRRVYLPSGAIGGLDVLRSARVDQLEEVTLTTTKPPRALAGAPFFEDHPLDLAAITSPTVIFEGLARDGVRLFPANVNVAAALSLAGIGADRTRMRIVADPGSDRNVHEVVARGSFGELHLTLSNIPSPANPKTSFLACLSPLAILRRLSQPIQLG